ncbi:MAG: SUMF1/EgtB/PvdO family nonheme iron enzyme [Chloroflexi bacterium]|nr:SUMF1/EgtB/PvdO family nonheme iron enzyme [Chloroflexota bacterium]
MNRSLVTGRVGAAVAESRPRAPARHLARSAITANLGFALFTPIYYHFYRHGKPCLGQPGNWRALRGGSWINNANNARAANRNNNTPANRNNNNGFRVVVVVRRSTPYIFLL